MSLIDKYNRTIKYLRLSVTDRCDLRCFYCMPNGFDGYEEPEDWLNFDEIERVIASFTRLGVSSVRLTGGEPLVRKNLPELAKRLAALPGLDDLSLSTNAMQLGKHAEALYNAGISRINASLDTVDPVKFKTITQGKLDKVVEGLLAAKAAGLNPIKINMVIMKGVNDDDVEDMVDFCKEHEFTLRFIETMPMGDTGRDAVDYYIDLHEIEARLEKKYELIPAVMAGAGPARYVQVAGTDLKIGFITPISQHFCDTCNRVRMSATGTLYMCLGDEHKYELRPLLRNGISDADLDQVIRDAINLKPLKHEFNEKPEKVVRFMSMTGG
ncbi:MAG: GTP 3',8-cyclase MoaA [gamma proteobacterium symbiont of Lucinoma myriamae]|nr:GTP 3',8-cyclase MoaA [gamma proteobacterium symbiont of Lucinoma myriamae]MCU7817528.1 GTP 3',8-cyclase MoaA [gamma proteobacterium symbiont of Lucinoma myriamae]MCU7831194.1 GTP 3',8-cyclase MoaA [gamma proteobacterium symbiont of Lucinoma myriamae]